jgi:heme iron utilization protein
MATRGTRADRVDGVPGPYHSAMPTGHQLPIGMGDGDGGAPQSARPPAPEPTHAERARTLVAGANRGVLSTVALEPAGGPGAAPGIGGYPFGSVATYAIDDAGRPIVFVSTMAEHTRNAAVDPRASLIVSETFPEGSDPLAAGRVTLIGDLLEVTGDDRPAVRDRYLAANPASAYYIDFGDFSFWRLEVRGVRYVGGYGRMSWVAAGDYARAEADPLAGEEAAAILEHMNADHAGSLVLMARVLGGREDATEVVMTAVDRYGFDVVVGGPAGRAALRLGFDAPVPSAAAVRPAMILLVERARAE